MMEETPRAVREESTNLVEPLCVGMEVSLLGDSSRVLPGLLRACFN